MDFETVDILYRSRLTLLAILKQKGYDTTAYDKFGPFEIESMASVSSSTGNNPFRMDIKRPADAATGGITQCRVEFIQKVKHKVATYIGKLLDTEEDPTPVDPKTTEVIVLTLEEVGDTFHAAVAREYIERKLRISFFQADTLVNNPANHILVPKHEQVPSSEHTALLEKLICKSKTTLPRILFHKDMQARILGLVPGDIVKITRASPSAGEQVSYRVCVF
jgi:DNA-directed RNA polymerase subunit H (RpoH/RPB5)